MKFFSLYIIILSVVLCSCSLLRIENRQYQSGIYIDFFQKNNFNKKTITRNKIKQKLNNENKTSLEFPPSIQLIEKDTSNIQRTNFQNVDYNSIKKEQKQSIKKDIFQKKHYLFSKKNQIKFNKYKGWSWIDVLIDILFSLLWLLIAYGLRLLFPIMSLPISLVFSAIIVILLFILYLYLF